MPGGRQPLLRLLVLQLGVLLTWGAADAAAPVLLLGRTAPGPDAPGGVGSLPQLLTWPASAARVRFTNSSSAVVFLNGSAEALPAEDSWVLNASLAIKGVPFGAARFAFEVDEELVGTAALTPDQPQLAWEWGGLDAGAAGPRRADLESLGRGGGTN